MVGSERWRPNAPRVIGEVIDDEAILIDLESGSYFSLVGTGALIWSGVEQGASVEDLVASLDRACGGVPADTDQQVQAFLAELADHQLIVAADGRPVVAPDGHAPAEAGATRPYEPPTLQQFDDMQELILLDPIHEVDEQEGWPRAKAPSSE
jgi:Coenzyme PQQ synthesis protein D (PqqD)